MSLHDIDAMPSKTIAPGFHAKIFHTETMTFSYVNVDAGATLPPHSHPHEQISKLISGEFDLIVDGETIPLTPGNAYAIPSNVPHTGKAHTECVILDIFSPVREDMK